MKKLLILPLLLVMLGCPSTPYGKAVKAGLDVTDTIHTGADTVDKLRLNGTLTVEEEKSALHYMQALNSLDTDVYGPCIQAAHLAGDKPDGFVACAQAMANSASDPALLNELHVSNPQSMKAVAEVGHAVANLMEALVNTLKAVK